MYIKVEIVEEEPQFEVSSATVKNEENIFNLDIQEDLNIDENETGNVSLTSMKKEPGEDDNIFAKKEFDSCGEDEQGLLEIKTELMVKSENEDDVGIKRAPSEKEIQDQTMTQRNLNVNERAKNDKGTIKKQIFNCGQCDYGSYRKTDLNRHVLAKHDEISNKKYSCNVCDYKTHYKSDLNRHVMSKHHENLIKYECDQCTYKTPNKKYLNKHILIKHISDAKKYNCSLCNYSTYYKRCFNLHLNLKHRKIA